MNLTMFRPVVQSKLEDIFVFKVKRLAERPRNDD